jgi:ribokinase
MTPGGKGANQAVAAAKLGSEVFLIARLGDDVFARKSLSNFEQEGVNTKYIKQTEKAPSGVALITVDNAGNNVIVVAPGANKVLSPEDVKNAQADIASAGALVAQLEIPLDTVESAARLAKSYAVPFILDPAPARKLSTQLLEMVDVLTPNETEAGILTDIEVTDEKSAAGAAQKLLEFQVKAVIVTMGKKGFLLADENGTAFIPAIGVDAVDTTAAGDAFAASLAVGLAKGKTLYDAALFANYVAALSVTKVGAQSSMPAAEQVEGLIKEMTNRGLSDAKT